MRNDETTLRTPPTQKGRERYRGIVDDAADLIFERGVAEVSLDDIREATGVSKSQLYHYFDDKDDLVHAVIACQRERVLSTHRQAFESLESWDDLQRWRDTIIARQGARGCRGGCPLGSLADGLSELDDGARDQLGDAFSYWGDIFATGLARMVDGGVLRADANPDELAIGLLASIQGGVLLAKTARNTRPLEIALDSAIAYLKSFAA